MVEIFLAVRYDTPLNVNYSHTCGISKRASAIKKENLSVAVPTVRKGISDVKMERLLTRMESFKEMLKVRLYKVNCL